MHRFLQSPAVWMAIFCALVSAGFWGWSRCIPDSLWEFSKPVAHSSPAADVVPASAAETPAPLATPAESTVAVAPTSEPSPTTPAAPAEVPAPTTAPSPDAPTVAAATATKPVSPPSDAELAGPLPEKSPAETAPATPVAQASPPAPAVAATPAPPLELADIAKQPQFWPKQVFLLAAVKFPVVLKGVNVGTMLLPPGRPVTLRKVNPDGSVEIELQGAQTKVSAQTTDVLARARAVAAAAQKTAPAP